jgi:hypothetical protein
MSFFVNVGPRRLALGRIVSLKDEVHRGDPLIPDTTDFTYVVETNTHGEYEIPRGHIDELIVQMIPGDGWELLLPYYKEVEPRPIIAWGLNPLGKVLPITAGCQYMMDQTQPDHYAVRRIGTEQVYDSRGMTYANVAEWIEHYNARLKRLERLT